MPTKNHRLIANRRLRLSDVPSQDAVWATIKRFARSYDPYSEARTSKEISRIGKARRHNTLHELRTCLFYEEEKWRSSHLSFFGEEVESPDPRKLAYLREILRLIRHEVSNRPPLVKPRRRAGNATSVRAAKPVSREDTPVIIPEPLVQFDRLLLASYQPDKRRAATGLSLALAKALGRVRNRGGTLIAELDELVGDDEALASSATPFNLPPNPLALCLTGTPRLVAAVGGNLRLVTKARFVSMHPPGRLSMRAVMLARDGVVDAMVDGVTAVAGLDTLSAAGWQVRRSSGEDLFSLLHEVEQILERLYTSGPPTPWKPPHATIPEPS